MEVYKLQNKKKIVIFICLLIIILSTIAWKTHKYYSIRSFSPSGNNCIARYFVYLPWTAGTDCKVQATSKSENTESWGYLYGDNVPEMELTIDWIAEERCLVTLKDKAKQYDQIIFVFSENGIKQYEYNKFGEIKERDYSEKFDAENQHNFFTE